MPLVPSLIIQGVDPKIWCRVLTKRRQTVGRSATCDIQLNHPSISRVHAEIRWSAGCFHLRDLESKNGTYYDGCRVKELSFEVGDSLRLGRIALRVINCKVRPTKSKGLETSTHSFEMSPDATGEIVTLLDLTTQFGLSRGQARVLRLLLQGLSEKEVAAKLQVSKHTVHTHAKNIYRVVRVHSRAELLNRYWTNPTAKPKGAR